MAMIDYGALVKKNGKIQEFVDLFNNYSTVDEDKSDRIVYDNHSENVAHNYMAVVGDEDYLIATYKAGISVFNDERFICGHVIGVDDDFDTGKYKLVKVLDAPFGKIKIRRLPPHLYVAIASFRYKDDNYEILFGSGVDNPKFLFSKHAKSYYDAKTLRRIRRWVKQGLK